MRPLQVAEKQLENWHRLGTWPEQALVVSTPMALSCRQPQLTTGGLVPTMVTVWLQVLLLPHWSVSSQVRMMEPEQRLLVTVLATETVTLLPLHRSSPVGGSKVQGEPHATVLLVTVGGQRATTETSSK